MSTMFGNIPSGIDKIEIRRKMNSQLSEARRNAKPSRCILCGKEQTSFCNSHSVPQMSLRAIAKDGKLLQASAAMGFDFVDLQKGVNNSGTFSFICRECDSRCFQEYEDPYHLVNHPTDKLLAEIAMKNMIQWLSKRAVEKELYRIMQRETGSFEDLELLLSMKSMDENEFVSELSFHRAIADQDTVGEYVVICEEVLPYKTPIAVQGAIVLNNDLEGNTVNNVYEQDATVRMQYLHIGVFPLDVGSVILVFCHKRDTAYDKFRQQFMQMSKDRQLAYLNYLIFAYMEDYFISPEIEGEIENNEKLQQLSLEVNGLPDMGMLNANNMYGIGYEPVTMDEIPNFLSEEWALSN